MQTATYETQAEFEELFSKHKLMKVLTEEFTELGNDSEVVEPQFATEVLAQMYLHRQCDVATLVGLMSRHGEPQDVADKILILVEEDFLDYDIDKERFILRYDLTDDVKQRLAMYQYPLPMVVKPKPVKNNFDTGYLTIKKSVILNGSEYFEDKDVCLDHLNRANSVALELSMETVHSEEGRYIRPTRNPNEDFAEFQKRQKQSDIFYATSVDVMESLNMVSNELYLTHRFDRRGRCYASGYHVNSQGTDYNKAVLTLANKELIE
jgi:hypothetical protein